MPLKDSDDMVIIHTHTHIHTHTQPDTHTHTHTHAYTHFLYSKKGILLYSGNTILHLSASNGHVQCVKWIVQTYPHLVHLTNNKNHSALHVAAANGHIGVIKEFITSTSGTLSQQVDDEGKVHFK